MVDDPQRSSPGALHHLARALKEVSGRVHRVGGIAELITRLQHKTLTCHPELRPPRDKGEDQMHRMRVFAPRPLWRVGLDGNVAIPARGPLRSDRIAVEGYREFALAEGRQSAVLRSDGERRGEHGSQASDERAAVHRCGSQGWRRGESPRRYHCADLSRICRTVSSSSRTLIGLPWKPSKPATMMRFCSWAITDAVTAITGMARVTGSARSW